VAIAKKILKRQKAVGGRAGQRGDGVEKISPTVIAHLSAWLQVENFQSASVANKVIWTNMATLSVIFRYLFLAVRNSTY
jgi:hypothetical protein